MPPFCKGWGDFVYGLGFRLSTDIVIWIAPYGGATPSGWLIEKAAPASGWLFFCLVPSV